MDDVDLVVTKKWNHLWLSRKELWKHNKHVLLSKMASRVTTRRKIWLNTFDKKFQSEQNRTCWKEHGFRNETWMRHCPPKRSNASPAAPTTRQAPRTIFGSNTSVSACMARNVTAAGHATNSKLTCRQGDCNARSTDTGFGTTKIVSLALTQTRD